MEDFFSNEQPQKETKPQETKPSYKVGDIFPISQVVGFRVIKRFDGNEPVFIETQDQAIAEVLSIAYQASSK